jgi:hypothetical protein
MIDIEADDVAVGIKVDDQAFDSLTRFRPGSSRELDVEAIGLRIIMQLHRKNALRTISPAFQDEPDVTQSARVETALGIFSRLQYGDILLDIRPHSSYKPRISLP